MGARKSEKTTPRFLKVVLRTLFKNKCIKQWKRFSGKMRNNDKWKYLRIISLMPKDFYPNQPNRQSEQNIIASVQLQLKDLRSEYDRKHNVLLLRIKDNTDKKAMERVKTDNKTVNKIFDMLDIQILPSTIY